MIADKYPWLMEPSLLTLLIRTLLALICAGAIGYERDVRGAAAGFRTHILVCIGAMLAMMTGQFTAMHFDRVDASRIGAQVISGIGFLGAGTIMVKNGDHIKGLTTAAGLWASACIGLALGVGFYEGAIVGAVAVFITEHVLLRVTRKIREDHKEENKERDLAHKKEYQRQLEWERQLEFEQKLEQMHERKTVLNEKLERKVENKRGHLCDLITEPHNPDETDSLE